MYMYSVYTTQCPSKFHSTSHTVDLLQEHIGSPPFRSTKLTPPSNLAIERVVNKANPHYM